MPTPYRPSPQRTVAHPPLPPQAPTQSPSRVRLDALDILPGIVMINMMIDHTRDFVNAQGFHFDPTDVTRYRPDDTVPRFRR